MRSIKLLLANAGKYFGKYFFDIFLMLLSLQRLPKVKSFKEMNKKTQKIPKLN